jgi:hypothetical protein
MARRIDLATVGGMLFAGAALLLLSSGVRVVRADEDSARERGGMTLAPAPLPDAQASCRVDAPRDTARDQALVDAGARLAEEAKQAAGDPDFVVLNNAGYNYGARTVTDPKLLDFEASGQPH